MSIKEIIVQYLEAHGYDGLCNPDQECGCFLQDIFPCDMPNVDDCRAGHKRMGKDGDWGIFADVDTAPEEKG